MTFADQIFPNCQFAALACLEIVGRNEQRELRRMKFLA
ncbi:MAG: hypothetical protein RL020_398 [Pseudomonadota bacterium]|jgi:hypothetical protein